MTCALRAFDREVVLRVSVEHRLRQDLGPTCFLAQQFRNIGIRTRGACVDRAMRREVAAEETCINSSAFDSPSCSEPNYAPVKFFFEPRTPPAHCLPPVHPFAAFGIFSFFPDRGGRLQQILFRSKEFVIS